MIKLHNIGLNQNEVTTDDNRILFSYATAVAAYNFESGKYYRTSKKWSKTTSKHINSWMPLQADPELVDQNFLDSLH